MARIDALAYSSLLGMDSTATMLGRALVVFHQSATWCKVVVKQY